MSSRARLLLLPLLAVLAFLTGCGGSSSTNVYLSSTTTAQPAKLGTFVNPPKTSGGTGVKELQEGGTGAGEGALVTLAKESPSVQKASGFNSAFGYRTLAGPLKSGGLNREGGQNSALGAAALEQDSEGAFNTAVGNVALQHNTIGGQNTAVGVGALRANTTGEYNTALGTEALESNISGGHNAIVGVNADRRLTTGSENAGLGQNAIEGAVSGSASFNSAIGTNTLKSLTNGAANTAAGISSLESLTTGSENVAAGKFAGKANITGNKNVYLGAHAGETASGSEELAIGDTASSPLIAGSFSGKTLQINGTLSFTAMANESILSGALANESVTEAKLAKSLLPQEEAKTITGATVTLNLAEHSIFRLTVEHTVEVKFTGAPNRPFGAEVLWTQHGAGPFPVTFAGIAWRNCSAPSFAETEGASNGATLTFYKGESTAPEGQCGVKGEKGVAGSTGATGAAGTNGEGVPTGGTTAQCLKKKSNTNFDTEWSSGCAGGAGEAPLLPVWLPITAKGSPIPTAQIGIGAERLAVFQRMAPAYKAGKIKEVFIYGGSTKNGNTKLAILDVGTKTSGKYTVLWESAEVELGTSGWTEMGKPELTVTAGQELLVGIMNSGTTQTFGETAASPGTATMQTLPGKVLESGGLKPKILGKHTFGSLSFGAAEATLSEAELENSASLNGFVVLGRIE